MMEWWRTASRNQLFHVTLAVAAIAGVLDQVSKTWILYGLELPTRVAQMGDGWTRTGHIDLSAVFDLTYVENRGVSFGLFAGGMTSRVLLTLLAVAVSIAVLHWAGGLRRRVAAIGAGLIVGGALGNAIDRVLYGYVVDFLDFSGLWFPWQFNIADVFINLGVACLAYDAFFVVGRDEKRPGPAKQSEIRQDLSSTPEPDPAKVTETKRD